MTATFPKSRDRARVAVFEWRDGLVATSPLGGNCDRLPHDLEHYVVEAQFRPAYGFWELAAQHAPFDSLTLVRGRWPKGRQEWLDRVRRKHGAEMLKAESVGLGGIGGPDVDLDTVWASRARTLRNAYTFTPDNPFARATKKDFVELRRRYRNLETAWRNVPLGGGLRVTWPPDQPAAPMPRYDFTAFLGGSAARR